MGTNKNNKSTVRNIILIPFQEKLFFTFKSSLKKYGFTVVPLMTKKLSSIIKLGKDKLEKWNEVNVVYEIQCNDCNAAYVGQTKRNLKKEDIWTQKNPVR